MKKKAFTLVEMLVTLGILAMVVVMVSGLANFTAGRLRSAQIKILNDSIRRALDEMAVRMNNANDEATIGGTSVYGFKAYDSSPNQMVVIVSKGETGSTVCTYFGLADNSLKTAQNNCSGDLLHSTDLSSVGSSLTPEKVHIKTFDLTGYKPMTDPSNTKFIPKLAVKITAVSANDINDEVNLATTFTMDGENTRNMVSIPNPEYTAAP